MDTKSVQRQGVKAAILVAAISTLAILSASQTVTLGWPLSVPEVTRTSASLFFGNQPVGTIIAQTIALRNAGKIGLNITSLAITGTSAGDFVQTDNCGSSVAADAKCTISVIFRPSASGGATALLSISDNASDSPGAASLSGTAELIANPFPGAVASLSPTDLSFGEEPVDVTSTAQAVTLSNTGNAALSITSLGLAGINANDFTQNSTCGSSLAAGAKCMIVVTFTPSIAGSETAALGISDNASNSPQAVSLSGTGAHDVILSWTASTTPGVAGYNVYRGITSGGESTTPLTGSPVAAGCTSSTSTTNCTYADTAVVVGTTYYYTVTAVASDGVTQSAPSKEVSATVPSS